ncbi:MAG: hypothetical protein ACLGJC_21315 [Alphaproteobacteria bacterium]
MATQTTTSTSSLPPWLDSAYQDLLSRAGTASQQGYQPYVDASGNAIPRVAGFSQDQLNAFQQVRDAQGRGDATFGQAQGMIQGAGGLSSLAAAQPYITAAGGNFGSRAAQPYFDQAAGMSSFSAASPLLNQGANVDAAAAANPLVTKGTGSWTNNVSSYMSPYTQQVTDRIADLGARNLSEKLLPAVNKTFIGSGQFGSTRNSEFTNRALRDTQEAVLGQQSQALESGYKTAADIYGQDASRQLQGGLGLGQLTDANAQRQIQAGTQLGNMTNADANRLTQIGQSAGQLMAGDLDRQLQMGALAGGLANNDASRQLQAGNALTSLAGARQNYDLTQANALSGVGAQQQQLGQNSLDTMYGDFQTQQGWDKNNLSWMSSILAGSAKPTTTTTTAPGASTGSQILGGLTTGVGLLGATGAFGNSGWLSGLFAEGGRVKLARGGLARPGFATGGAVDYTTMPDDILQQAYQNGDQYAARELSRRQDAAGFSNLARNAGKAIGRGLSALNPNAFKAAPDNAAEEDGSIPFSPHFAEFGGAYPTQEEIGGGLGLAMPLPGRKPAPPIARTIDLPRSDYSASTADPYMTMTPEQQVRQDIEEEVGPSPGPTPMGGLGSPQPPTGNAPRGGLLAPADAGGGSDRWGADGDIWNTLLATGAGMLSSRSPTMAGGIGEGLQSGLGAAQAQKDRALKQKLLERQQGNDDTRLGLEKRRVDVTEQREKREAASDLLTLTGAGDKNQPAQAKMIKYLMDGGMSREEATDRVFGAKTDPLERAKLVGNMAKIYAESGDDPDAALEKARKTVDMLAPPRTSNARGASNNPGIKVGTQARRADGSTITWNGKQWVAQ